MHTSTNPDPAHASPELTRQQARKCAGEEVLNDLLNVAVSSWWLRCGQASSRSTGNGAGISCVHEQLDLSWVARLFDTAASRELPSELLYRLMYQDQQAELQRRLNMPSRTSPRGYPILAMAKPSA